MVTIAMNDDNEVVLDGSNEWVESCCECLQVNDNWGGTGDNSGALGDIANGCRWDRTKLGGTDVSDSITGGKYLQFATSNCNPQNQMVATLNMADVAGDFSFTIDASSFVDGVDQGTHLAVATAVVYTATRPYIVQRISDQDSGTNIMRGTGAASTDSTFSGTSWSVDISRSGSTITLKYDSTTLRTDTDSGDLISADIRLACRDAGATPSVSWDNFVFTDGGVEVEICG